MTLVPDGTPTTDGMGHSSAAALALPVLAELLTSLPDAVVLVDPDGKLAYANSAACSLLGSTWKRLAHRDFLGCFLARDRSMVETNLLSCTDKVRSFSCLLPGPEGGREVVCQL